MCLLLEVEASIETYTPDNSSSLMFVKSPLFWHFLSFDVLIGLLLQGLTLFSLAKMIIALDPEEKLKVK